MDCVKSGAGAGEGEGLGHKTNLEQGRGGLGQICVLD
jgi:hypothetical protein